ncbi:adaptin N terminal region-domain-containing protein [Umbelopsis sp. AD052]|nr:adaptin N terminal region-domain-containing protein [Umbelopsis sp. AD052]
MNSINSISQQILAKLPLYRLKDLIKAIRACKTAADERAVIQRESANIRTAFKEENSESRHANVSKLLYIHMLGYPAHFGQMECLKLVAGPKYADKRLGYLGIMLLIDEKTEVLTLVTNSLKNDMNHSNMYIVGLALCTLGNISSPEMARDLCGEVEKLLGSSNTYIRKKAALCALRIIRRVPDLQENFVSKAKSLLADKSHGVQIAGITLITEMCQQSSETLQIFKKAVPLLVRNLKNLITAGFSPEHDVTGLTDPFLQVKILRLMRILAANDQEASDAMNDVLAQVATNTESSKNVGNSILYETVLTIMGIQSEAGLRVLAVNILGKFLGNRDNNIRYVALETLNKTVNIDTQAVQRHRNIIMDCLRDGDISIRRRALELSFALINESNVRVLTRELLAFLEVADSEFKQSMTIKIALAARKFAPNRRWHIDTMLRVLKLAGNFVREENLAGFIRLVAQSSELHQYTVQKLYSALKSDISQEALVLAGVWVIGEYGDVLVSGGNFEDDDVMKEVSEGDILNLFESILNGPYANQVTREYIATSLMKLSARFNDTTVIHRIQGTLQKFTSSMEVEIQQRAVEYSNLFSYDNIRPAVLERMPVPEERLMSETTGGRGTPSLDGGHSSKAGPSDQDLLLDLMGVGTASGGAAQATPEASPISPSTSSKAPPAGNNMDLLADIFGSGSQPAPQSPPPSMGGGGLLDMLGQDTPTSPRAQQQRATSPGLQSMASLGQALPSGRDNRHQAFAQDGLVIYLTPTRDQQNPTVINIQITFANDGSQGTISEMQFQAAVPKTQRLQMAAASSNVIQPGSSEKQMMRVANPQQVSKSPGVEWEPIDSNWFLHDSLLPFRLP